ncbi:DNA polymerase I [Bordetella hinzii]|uniref:DNA polymerase I n=1 Tax=Bordetella hinzii TaxID=103855 RepID=UPI0013EFF0D8|nr:DNA polymerase I [Bordetella hinzii]QII84202.1 DNA polymerase I [Bordetella hinzii]
MKRLWLDFETYSDVPITYGTHAYAERAEIMLVAFALNDAPVEVWDVTTGGPMPATLRDALDNPDVEVWAHNSHFDRTVMRHAWPGFDVPLTRWRDTMVKALAHSLPGALGTLCEILKVPLDKAKDKEGKRLIQLFCKPRPATNKIKRATRDTHPVDWERFVNYAGLDIDAMREVDARLPSWNYRGEELALWHLDQTINDRGFTVDLELARAAIRATEREKGVLARRTQELTDDSVQAATQRDAMLSYLLEAFGLDLPDMQQATLERRLNDPDLPIELRELLGIRLQASTTSTSKYKTLVNGASSDGRLRGCLQFDGAARTGRWAGRLFQPQNLPRPSLKQSIINEGIELLKADCADVLFDDGDIMTLTSSAIRGALVSAPGKKLVVADLSNIEGRGIAWEAGEEWKLQAFADFDAGRGHDLYAVAYARAFAITPDEVMENKESGDGMMRQIGKVMELMLGYEGGVGAFLTGAATYRIDLDAMAKTARPSIPADVWEEAEEFASWRKAKHMSLFGLDPNTFCVCDSLKRLWRREHPNTVAFWRDLLEAARLAVINPGETFECRALKLRRDGAWLRIRLPSGRFLCYPSPQIDENGKLSYMGVHQYTRKWTRLYTYGGKLAENITQAIARDVLASSMAAIEQAGFEIVLTVHDEVLTEAPDTADYTPELLAQLMTDNPPWAEGLPLAAAGFEAYRYKKE